MIFLERIMAHKHLELKARKASRPLEVVLDGVETAPAPMDFVAALRRSTSRPALIAEIKRASPSRGLLAPDFDPVQLAHLYHQNGAAAISVLTDAKHFQGDLGHLEMIACQTSRPPLLRKDFIFDPYQIYESRAAGADAVLLIAAVLTPTRLHELNDLIRQLGMVALVEVHTRQELDMVLPMQPEIIGVNNRDLRSFRVDLRVAKKLIPAIPQGICTVAESGIKTLSDVAEMAKAGASAILVGEALLRAPDVAEKVRELAKVMAHES